MFEQKISRNLFGNYVVQLAQIIFVKTRETLLLWKIIWYFVILAFFIE